MQKLGEGGGGLGAVSTGWQIRCTVRLAVVAAKKMKIGKAREGRLPAGEGALRQIRSGRCICSAVE